MPPINPRQLALDCLLETDVARKLTLTAVAFAAVDSQAPWVIDAIEPGVVAIPVPGRPPTPVLVPPNQLAQRKLNTVEGRAALIHAVAHIEFNAINLAWDAVYRFPGLPDDYYRDWASVAADEARHFQLLSARLSQLGFRYGDFPAHDGLWQMACDTAHDVMVRMALVPRVLEARGLDVTPGMIERLRRAGDAATIDVLEVILREEVRHVAIGSRWFATICAQRGLRPRDTFLALVQSQAAPLRLPFNVAARLQAGFDQAEIDGLTQLASA
jgi:uncharacterized ferritin-like protein (DUF455 family)